MPIPSVVTSKDQIPQGREADYREEGGVFVLDLDNESIKLHPATHGLEKAYRETQEKLDKSKEEAKALRDQIGGLDIEKAKTLLEQEDQIRLQKLIKDGQFETALANEREKVSRETEIQIQTLKEEKTGLSKTIQNLVMKYELALACVEAGLPVGVHSLLRSGAEEIFAVNNEHKLVALDSKGRQLVLDGETPLTIGAWVEQTAEKFGLYPPSSGGDARPPKQRAPQVTNPWAKETLNLSEQARILSRDPELAQRLQAEANHAA